MRLLVRVLIMRMKGKIAITREAEFRSMVVRDINDGTINININPNDDMIKVFQFAMYHIKIWLKNSFK